MHLTSGNLVCLDSVVRECIENIFRGVTVNMVLFLHYIFLHNSRSLTIGRHVSQRENN